jgi:hypothetical protein
MKNYITALHVRLVILQTCNYSGQMAIINLQCSLNAVWYIYAIIHDKQLSMLGNINMRWWDKNKHNDDSE